MTWCEVLENRPEIITRRDKGTPMDWFKGKIVVLWGCGAIGGQLAEQLARAGVSELRLYDCGRVHPGVLVRQNYTDADINDYKACALGRRLKAIAPKLKVTPYPYDIIEIISNIETWHIGVDVLIDATASLCVRSKLEMVLKSAACQTPIVAMMISGQAQYGTMVMTPPAYSGGPLDAYRRLGHAAKHRTWLRDYAMAFWGNHQQESMRQPEPGCSDPTFIGSHADIAGLSARMMNQAATALMEDTDSAVGVFVRGNIAKQHDAIFKFKPDIVVRAQETEFRLAASAWRDVRGWIRAGARARTPEDETGGLLFGEVDELLGVTWISNVSGPASDSQFSPEQFVCGVDGTETLCDSYKSRSFDTIQYIGTWHSHPVSQPEPSKTDICGIDSIFAMNSEGGGIHQVMMIIGYAVSRSPQIGLYIFEKDLMERFDDMPALVGGYDGGQIEAPEPPRLDKKIGLALSGGGSRAVAFHLGTLRALEDLGLLNDIEVISGVSGGSVMAGLLGYSDDNFSEIDLKTISFLERGLVWPALIKQLNPLRFVPMLAAFTIVTVPSILLNMLVSLLKIVGKTFPNSLKVNIVLSRLRWPIPRWYSPTHVMRDAIGSLVGTKSCDSPTRQNKTIVFNACELRTTTAFRMDNQQFGSWRFGWSPASKLTVAEAITASAAFPLILPPFDWTREFTLKDRTKKQRVLITDGGIFDNIGTSVIEPGSDPQISEIHHPVQIIIASDASAGQFSGNDFPASFKARVTQAFNSVMRKVNDAKKQRLHKQAEHGDIERFVYVNLGQIDDRVPLKAPNWVDRNQVVDYPTNFSSMSKENIQNISGRGETITRTLATLYLLSD